MILITFSFFASTEDEIETENVELNDPAILAVQYVKYRYERDELLTIRNLPLSKKRPEILDSAYDR